MPVGCRSVPRAEFLAVLAEQVSTALDASTGSIRQDREGVGMLAAAWRLIVFGQARAVVRLLGAGFEVEPQANARVCFEHAVAMHELALAAEADELDAAMEQLAGDAGRHHRRQVDHLAQVDAETGGLNRSLVEAVREDFSTWLQPSGHRARQVRDMFERVSPGGALYNAYGRMSNANHAGVGSATPYLQMALRAGSAIPAVPETVPWAETLALLCWGCCTAENAMLQFLEDGSDLAARQVDLLALVGLVPE